MASTAAWQDIARRKQAERLSRIPKEWVLPHPPPPTTLNVLSTPSTCGILSASDLAITTQYDAVALASAIKSSQLTAEAVTTAFCKRAAIAQQVSNCLTEIFFDSAIAHAKSLDAEYARTGKVVGPLHGVPISIKDSFKVRGYDSCIGVAALAFQPATENSPLVDILLELGAVLYCKTNVPQAMLALDSENNVFGRVLNPRNIKVTAGGSSGGEGALLALRGSILGVGTDVGGSIRIPAMCNGLYGVKPSIARIPYAGQESGGHPGGRAIGVAASAGPIATTMRDCEFLLQVISDSRPWEKDPAVSYGLWADQGNLTSRPLFGVLRTDNLITPLPPITRIIDETVNALRKSGVEVIEIDPTNFGKGHSLFNAFSGIDGGQTISDLLDKTGEPWSTWLAPRMRRKAPFNMSQLLDLHAKKIAWETEMLRLWRDPKTGRQVDAIICPVAPHPTPPIDRWNGLSYTANWVVLDCPTGTIPVREFSPADLRGEVEGKVLGPWDKANRTLWDEKTVDKKLYLGTSLCVQVVVPKMQERRLVKAMEVVDAAVRGGEMGRSKL